MTCEVPGTPPVSGSSSAIAPDGLFIEILTQTAPFEYVDVIEAP